MHKIYWKILNNKQIWNMFQLVCAIKKKTHQSPYFIGEDDPLFAKQFPTMFKHMLYI